MTPFGAAILTIFAGYLGDAILGDLLNWPGAGAITAVAVMGGFILQALGRGKETKDTDPTEE